MFPSPQNISILEGTKDVSFTRNLPEYLLLIPNGTYFIKLSAYIIPEISVSDTGEYSLLHVTNSDQECTTTRIYIQVLLAPIEPVPDNHIIQIIIIGAIIILITIFGIVYITKRKKIYFKLTRPTNATKSDVTDAEHKPGNVNLSEITQATKEYIDISFNTNPEYMTINETSMIPLDSEPETTDYANLSNKQTYNPTPKYHTIIHNKST
ncbi:hypothetical protein LOD99_10858 [Oopsacas minuta]|uniref:Uncharacterized protein n=1 Tax=Oopsacas minuta TaxID=111878 RepID=A0AAV7KBY3_9METZ|nr:hypothetical protein LOD99_10858 [Oopsacas minuta]